MAKAKKTETNKKDEPKTLEVFMAEVEAKQKEVDEVLENFRTSFKNLDNQLGLLKDRNRLR